MRVTTLVSTFCRTASRALSTNLRCAGLVAAVLTACTERPVIPGEGTALERLARIELSFSAGANLLLVIDDSISMGDKQKVLAQAMSGALALIKCQSADGTLLPFGDHSAEDGVQCKVGMPRTGIITSSLSAAGNTNCEGRTRGAHLLPAGPDKLFLGSEDVNPERIEQWIRSVGEEGCGYESPLEAMYRFLIDPAPLLEGSKDEVDTELLRQRESFLMPASSLTILILTDEDDCSVMDTESGALMLRNDDMPRGTASCARDPQDVCCRSCAATEELPPEGCTALVDDENCNAGPLPPEKNDINVRCFDQRRRFGESALYPIERYVRGLTERTILDRQGREVINPLFADGRTADMVHLAVVAGVPWQLLATDDTRDDPEQLTLLTPRQLHQLGVWDTLAAEPHLVASLTPRPNLAAPTAPRLADPVHGHEFENPHEAALQYSCIFPMPEPVDCTTTTPCICEELEWPNGAVEPLSPNNPLCQAEDETYGTRQYFAAAEPPVRLLEVARKVNALLGSACPKTLSEALNGETAYGYTALGAALQPWFAEAGFPTGMCLEEKWPDDALTTQRCKVIERVPKRLDCSLPGRAPVAREYAEYALSPGLRYEDFTFCEVLPVPGDQQRPGTLAYSCAHDVAPDPEALGYCFIDPSRDLGSPELVKMCPPHSARRVRLLPANLGREDAWLVTQTLRLVCR
jgi:hypothetical protein